MKLKQDLSQSAAVWLHKFLPHYLPTVITGSPATLSDYFILEPTLWGIAHEHKTAASPTFVKQKDGQFKSLFHTNASEKLFLASLQVH